MASTLLIAHEILINIIINNSKKIPIGLNRRGLRILIFSLNMFTKITPKRETSNKAIRKCLKLVISCIHKGGKSCISKRKQINILVINLGNVLFLLSVIVIMLLFL